MDVGWFIDSPMQPVPPNMSEWVPLWKLLENRTTFLFTRFGLFMYWVRGAQGTRAFQMAVPIVRCFSLLYSFAQRSLTTTGQACIQVGKGTQEHSTAVLHPGRRAQKILGIYGTMCAAARDANAPSPPLGSPTLCNARPPKNRYSVESHLYPNVTTSRTEVSLSVPYLKGPRATEQPTAGRRVKLEEISHNHQPQCLGGMTAIYNGYK